MVDAAGMAVLGAGVTATAIGANTLIQRRTPADLLGRVDAAADVLVTVPQTLFIGLGAALVAAVDYRLVLALVTVLMVASGTWLATRRPAAPSAPAVGWS